MTTNPNDNNRPGHGQGKDMDNDRRVKDNPGGGQNPGQDQGRDPRTDRGSTVNR
jgi:hypothetical protein